MNIRDAAHRTVPLCVAMWVFFSPGMAESVLSSNVAAPLILTTVGHPRQLPERILGASVEPLIEHLLGDVCRQMKWEF